MIAKRVPRPKGTSDFARLGRYVVDARGRRDPSTWERTADYLLDTTHAGAKVSGVRITNCHTDDDPAAATLEILAVQARNTRARGDKTYHLVVSFPPGERPTLAQLHAIEDALVEEVGFGEHQRLSAVHTDRNHLHVHVAINTVHPRTLRNVAPAFDKRRLMAACERLEIAHGLTRTNHGITPERAERGRATDGADVPCGARPDRARDMERFAGRESLHAWITAHVVPTFAPLLADDAPAIGWEALHAALARFDLELRPRGAGLVLATRPGASGSTVRVKASAVDRALSIGALTRRFGPFEAPSAAVRETVAERSYASEVEHGRPSTDGRAERPVAGVDGDAPARAGSGSLFERYQRARAAALAARRAELVRLARDAAEPAARLRAAYLAERVTIRRASHLRPAERRAALRALGADRQRDRARAWTEALAGRRLVCAAHPVPRWREFLADAAAGGDPAAQAALRALDEVRNRTPMRAGLLAPLSPGVMSNREEARGVGDVSTARRLSGADAGRAAQVRMDGAQVGRRGGVRYVLADSGVVTDAGRVVRVDQVSAGAIALALRLTAARADGRPLAVRGEEAFRVAVRTQARALGLIVYDAGAPTQRSAATSLARTAAADDAASRVPARVGEPEQPPPARRARRR